MSNNNKTIMNKETLSKQHAQLKEQLADITDFINSEEYYKLTDHEKNLIATQRTGMEVALSAMSFRLWGDKTRPSFNHSMFGLLSLMFGNPFNSPTPSFPPIEPTEPTTTKEEGQ